MEFDKSKVYSAVNADQLKPGDKVIVANTINALRQRVQKADRIWTIKQINPDDCEYRFESNDRISSLAYLVERKENCTNCEGCVGLISRKPDKTFGCEHWKSQTEQKAEVSKLASVGMRMYLPGTSCNSNKHHRQFQDTEELVKVWNEKIGMPQCLQTDGVLTMPYIWIRQKECSKGGLLITYFGEDEVKTDMGFLTMSKLLSDYIFTDGSPCGVEE